MFLGISGAPFHLIEYSLRSVSESGLSYITFCPGSVIARAGSFDMGIFEINPERPKKMLTTDVFLCNVSCVDDSLQSS